MRVHSAELTLPSTDVADAIASLRDWFEVVGDVTVAFSGGADSALLAKVATEICAERALVVTAVSPSLAGREEQDCAQLADEWNMNWQTVATSEMLDAAYRRNDVDRCGRCKTALMDALAPVQRGTVVLGVNTDDLNDHRPGQVVAADRGARFPFVELGIDKAMVRSMSRSLGLRTWDKPAAACLASRIPHGTPVSVSLLAKVERAEDALLRLGLGQLRVRDHGDIARIEVDPADMATVLAARAEVVEQLIAIGYRFVTLDLGGFRSGSLNPVP